MSHPATPTKRVFTEEAHNAKSATRVPYGNFVPDDLTARLQNLGSRVRKSVNEGYTTQRFGGIPSVTPTPFSSPMKPTGSTTSPQGPQIFRSANDTLLDVFSSPVRSGDTGHSASPFRKKRRHADIEHEEEGGELSSSAALKSLRGDLAGMETLSEDEEVTIITEGDPKHSPIRPMRPLRISGRTHRPPDAPSAQPCITKSCFNPSVSSSHTEETTRVTSDWENMFNQPF